MNNKMKSFFMLFLIAGLIFAKPINVPDDILDVQPLPPQPQPQPPQMPLPQPPQSPSPEPPQPHQQYITPSFYNTISSGEILAFFSAIFRDILKCIGVQILNKIQSWYRAYRARAATQEDLMTN
jgi:hypothetical protein